MSTPEDDAERARIHARQAEFDAEFAANVIPIPEPYIFTDTDIRRLADSLFNNRTLMNHNLPGDLEPLARALLRDEAIRVGGARAWALATVKAAAAEAQTGDSATDLRQELGVTRGYIEHSIAELHGQLVAPNYWAVSPDFDAVGWSEPEPS